MTSSPSSLYHCHIIIIDIIKLRYTTNKWCHCTDVVTSATRTTIISAGSSFADDVENSNNDTKDKYHGCDR